MVIDTVVAKLFNCKWNRRNKNEPADSIDVTIYDNKADGELILFELSRRSKHITHITLSKKQLVAVLRMNQIIKHNDESAIKVPMLPDAKCKPTQDVTCGLNRIR